MALIEHVKHLGVEFHDPEQLTELFIAIRYAEKKIGNLSDAKIAEELNTTVFMLNRINNTQVQTPNGPMSYSALSTQILMVDFFTTERKMDRRSIIYGAFDELLPDVIINQLRLAAGKPGLDSSRPPSYRDQIDAGKGVLNNPIAMSYMKLLLTGKDSSEWEEKVPVALEAQLTLD